MKLVAAILVLWGPTSIVFGIVAGHYLREHVR